MVRGAHWALHGSGVRGRELCKRGFLNMFSYCQSCCVWLCLAGLGRMAEICLAQAPELSLEASLPYRFPSTVDFRPAAHLSRQGLTLFFFSWFDLLEECS